MKSYSVPEGKGGASMSKGSSTFLAFLGILGMILVAAAAILYGKVFPDIYRRKVNEALFLRNGSDAMKRFERPILPIYLKFHIFNVTNPNEANQLTSNPEVEELGPYVFRVQQEKRGLNWNEERGSVTYQTHRTFHFEPDMSVGKLEDIINHVNIVAVGLVQVFESQKALATILGLSVDELVSEIRGELVETHTAEELLFKGFLMEKYFPEEFTHLCRLRNDCMFGFYYGKNDSLDNEFEVSTGEKDISTLGTILQYNKQSQLPYHFEDECNKLNGSEGSQAPPGLSKDDTIYFFVSDICRSMEFQYNSDVEVNRIPALHFTVPDRVFADPNKQKENMCFCQKRNETEPCAFKGGVLQLSSCKEGSPVLASQPHFFLGELEYLDDVRGLKPSRELHESYVDIEPVTGNVIRGSKKLQINAVVSPDHRLRFVKQLKKKFYFPVFWIEETAAIDERTATAFRSRVLTPYLAGKWTLLGAIILGAVMVLFVTLTCTIKVRFFECTEDDPHLSNKSSEIVTCSCYKCLKIRHRFSDCELREKLRYLIPCERPSQSSKNVKPFISVRCPELILNF